jgi:hypothetical protein
MHKPKTPTSIRQLILKRTALSVISKDRDHEHECMGDDIVSFVNIIFVGTQVDATHLTITIQIQTPPVH